LVTEHGIFGSCRCGLATRGGSRALLIQGAKAKQEAANDRAACEDSPDPPECGVIAVCRRKSGASMNLAGIGSG
jgi:hypothetical protein